MTDDARFRRWWPATFRRQWWLWIVVFAAVAIGLAVVRMESLQNRIDKQEKILSETCVQQAEARIAVRSMNGQLQQIQLQLGIPLTNDVEPSLPLLHCENGPTGR